MEITNIVDELPKHAKEKYRTRKLKDIKRIVVPSLCYCRYRHSKIIRCLPCRPQ